MSTSTRWDYEQDAEAIVPFSMFFDQASAITTPQLMPTA